ncbi:putative ion channel [Stipitochalara longipes BDJ]|nr:putative ion channel [Stipitochalara longipes BDJ]
MSAEHSGRDTPERPRHLLHLEASQEMLAHAGEEVVSKGKRMWEGFSDFALQDNVLEVAVGLIIAAAFTTVVTSFVSEILLPPLSLIPGINRNMDSKFAILRRGPNYNKTMSIGYNTLEQAAADGAVVMAYGTFVNKVINFLGVGFALYGVALVYEMFSTGDPIIKHMVKCKYCRKRISVKAKRCVNCTSWQDGREDKVAEAGDLLR